MALNSWGGVEAREAKLYILGCIYNDSAKYMLVADLVRGFV